MTTELENTVRRALEADAPATCPAIDWSALSARSRRRTALRRGASVALGGALVGALVLAAPWSGGGGSTALVPAAPPALPTPFGATPWSQVPLDENGCPSGTTVIRSVDELGATAVVQTGRGKWVCTAATSSPAGESTFFSSPWDDVEVASPEGSWLGPLILETCDGNPCDTVIWSAAATLPPSVARVTVQVTGESEIHQADVSDSMWAIRLRRPATENVIDNSSHTITGDTLVIQLQFGHAGATDEDDAHFVAVTTEFRAVCEQSHATTEFPAWNELACTDEVLQHNIGSRAVDFAFSVRFDAQCEWYAEYLVATDEALDARASDALAVIGDIPDWPGYRGTEFGSFASHVYQRALEGDLTIMRERFPRTPDAGADCSYDYLEQASAWAP